MENLRRIASEATQGEWKAPKHEYASADEYAVDRVKSSEGIEVIGQLGCGCCDVGLEISEADAKFLETFHPQRVLALLAELEKLDSSFLMERDQRKHAEEQVKRVKRLADDAKTRKIHEQWIAPEAIHEELERKTIWS
ncbi:hypothetical protein [Glutamicibacter uratoxydans]|nr:hypothetical protein [Glutamicibacter uratoxydans]